MIAIPEYQTPQPGEWDSIQSLISLSKRAVEALNTEAGLYLEQNDDAAAAALLLYDLREHRKALADLEAAVEATAAQRMTGKVLGLPGFMVERKGGLKRTAWEHDRLGWAVTADLAVDPNGEIDDSAAHLIGLVRDRIINAAGISYWRTTQLKELGIDAGDFSVSERGRYTVHVTKAVTE